MVLKNQMTRGIMGIILLVFICQVNAQITQPIPFKKVTVENRNGQAIFSGAELNSKPGSPKLPSYTVTILLPPNAEPKDVSVQLVDVVETKIPGEMDVQPVFPPTSDGKSVWPTSLTIVNGRDQVVYKSNKLFPSSPLGAVKFGFQNQYKLMDITIYPFRYNPVNRTLVQLTSGKIVVNGIKTRASKSSKKITKEDWQKQKLRSIIANPDALDQYSTGTTSSTIIKSNNRALSPNTNESSTAMSNGAGAAYGDGYVVITTTGVLNQSTQLIPFVLSKQAKGFSTHLITENVWGGGIGDTAADRIRSFLQTYLNEWNIRYVLLIGDPRCDVGEVPMKRAWPRLGLSGLEGQDAPTDFYYADLSNTWDPDSDGNFGSQYDYLNYYNGPDRFAEVSVGRIPYYGNIGDLDGILEKTISYQNTPQAETGWRMQTLLSAKPMDGKMLSYTLGEAIKDDIIIPASGKYFRIYDQVGGVPQLNPPAELTPCQSVNVFSTWVAAPFGTVIWFTHGQYHQADDIFSTPYTSYLNNYRPSFTFQASCFNSQPEYSTNVSYSLLRNGGIATIGATRASWYYSEETNFTGSSTIAGMAYGFAKYFIGSQMPVGDALNTVRSTIYPNDWAWWTNWLIFNVYGDPSMALNSYLTSPRTLVFAVNAGSTSPDTTLDGAIYAADTYYMGGSADSTTNTIAGTNDDALYQTERTGTFTYTIPNLANGSYDVVFKFAENYWNYTDQRKFNISLEGQTLVSDLDIFAKTGAANSAYDLTVPVMVSDGELNIEFSNGSADQPTVCAIAVYAKEEQPNQVPIVYAGIFQNITINNQVTLSSVGSIDPDNGPQPLTYSWTQISGPTVVLTNATTQHPTFTPTTVGFYNFRCTVSDGEASVSGDCYVNVHWPNNLPNRIQAEWYKIGGEGMGYHDLTSGNSGAVFRNDDVDIAVTNDLSGNYHVTDIEAGEYLNYDIYSPSEQYYTVTMRVKTTSAGVKSIRILIDGTDVGKDCSFSSVSNWTNISINGVRVPAGDHELRIVCETGGFDLNYLNFVVYSNQKPIAEAGPEQTVYVNQTVQLDGSASYDPDNFPNPLTYYWTISTAPVFDPISNRNIVNPTFTPTTTGRYVMWLMVSDGNLSSTDTVVINVIDRP